MQNESPCYSEFGAFEDVFSPNNKVLYSLDSKLIEKVNVSILDTAKYQEEMFKNVEAVFYPNGDLDLAALLETLRGFRIQLDRNMIYYHSPRMGMFVYCGKDPVHPKSFIPASDITYKDGLKWITIRIRYVEPQMALKHDPTIAETQKLIQADTDDEDESVCSNSNECSKRRRHKERNIGEVLDLVYNWRKLYAGIQDPNTNKTIKLSLDEAAKKVGVAKKSLDDYLLQIRAARKYGFNFHDNQHKKIGLLRTFVKEEKQKEAMKRSFTSSTMASGFDSFNFIEEDQKKANVAKSSKKIRKEKTATYEHE